MIFERRMAASERERMSRCGSLITRLITFLITGIYSAPFIQGPIKFQGDDVERRDTREKNLKSAYLSACRTPPNSTRALACGIVNTENNADTTTSPLSSFLNARNSPISKRKIFIFTGFRTHETS